MSNMVRVEEDSPNRCQSTFSGGQCVYEVIPGTNYCKMHCSGVAKAMEQTKIRNYRLQQYQSRINEKADSDSVKNLREEIGILRLILEEVINRCKDDNDLMIYSSKIADLVLKIEKVVTSCHRLETSLGQTLDKTTIMNISTRIINIISEYVSDENTMNNVINDIGKMLQES